jgi:hypothetical protein
MHECGYTIPQGRGMLFRASEVVSRMDGGLVYSFEYRV